MLSPENNIPTQQAAEATTQGLELTPAAPDNFIDMTTYMTNDPYKDVGDGDTSNPAMAQVDKAAREKQIIDEVERLGREKSNFSSIGELVGTLRGHVASFVGRLAVQ